MIAKIIPGIMNTMAPRIMRMPVMMLTASSESSFDMVKLKLVLRSALPFSNVSAVNFTPIPWVIWLMTQPTMPAKKALARTAPR